MKYRIIISLILIAMIIVAMLLSSPTESATQEVAPPANNAAPTFN